MALPFLPGNSFNRNLGKEKYHKSQIFDNKNDIRFMFGTHKPGIGGDRLPGQQPLAPFTHYPPGEANNQPAWVAFDKQVLSFDAYYQEGVQESRNEQYRIHHVKIYFYLEDDSMQIIEPRIKNSGLPQGTVMRRHRVNKPAPNDNFYFTADDLNVGQEITLYGRIYRIISCDEFTHNFLRKMGVKVGLPEPLPTDPYGNLRKAMEESMQPLRPYERHDTLRQFLDHDRHVLRFFCFWDDTESMYGDPREMVLHYFLADDTIEIREVVPPNSGRDSGSVFYKRSKLPRKVEDLRLPGELCDRTLLNVFGHIQKGRYVLDNLKTGAVNVDYYDDSYLTIGTYINVLGRKFLICDCDEFTKEYYRTKYGITDFTPITRQKGTYETIKRTDPPYNGWGNVEDSLGNTKGLMPRPPKRDFIKFMEKDRTGLESHVLRFQARLDTTKHLDQGRKFIISYFLSDDSILIFEPPIRNSGVLGGKFLERQKIKLPGQERYGTDMPNYFQAQDLFIGARVVMNNYKFIIEDADEYAYRYMETHSDEFPKSNINLILSKLSRILAGKREQFGSFFSSNDPDGSNSIAFEQFQTLMHQCTDNELSEHEIMTLGRHYALRVPEEQNATQIISVAQSHLRKKNYDSFAPLRQACHQADKTSSGRHSVEQMRILCKTVKLPLPDDLLRSVIEATGIDEDGQVDYETFVSNINWREKPLMLNEVTAPIKVGEWQSNNGQQIDRVQWNYLLNDIFGSQ